MRLKHGRPDLADYARFFDAPTATPQSPLQVTWAGVTTLLIHDGSSAVLTDGFFSRPPRRVLTRLATADGVTLHLPTLWEPADPWA
jgi:L-ascorbate metabolism protein UlaG (beta-lactamase superfamily)